jgi:hypothetical protein
VSGKDNFTMPVTREYADGHERIFGKREAQPGRWVQDPSTGKLIPAESYTGPATEEARNAPVMVDRFYENTSVPVYENGQVKQVDIGSRKRHREYMRQRGLTTADDYDRPGGEWERAAKEREQRAQGIFPDARERRMELGRIAYEVEKKKNARRR